MQDIGNCQPCDPNFCEFDSFIGPSGSREVNEYVYKQEEPFKTVNSRNKMFSAKQSFENSTLSILIVWVKMKIQIVQILVLLFH